MNSAYHSKDFPDGKKVHIPNTVSDDWKEMTSVCSSKLTWYNAVFTLDIQRFASDSKACKRCLAHPMFAIRLLAALP